MSERDAADLSRPAWLQDLIAEYSAPPAEPAPDSPSAGEFWYATGESGVRRILLVLATDQSRGLARAAIASTELDVATEQSLVFSSAEVGTAFNLVVETDLVMPVWLRQLEPFVGRVPISVEMIRQAAEARQFAPELEARRGMPLHGPHDTRVAVRDQELDDLWDIAGDCVAELEDWDAERAMCDPRLVRAAWEGEQDYGAVLAVLRARRQGASLGPWTYMQLRERRRSEPRPSLSPDLAAALGRFENGILVALQGATPPPVHHVEWLPAPLSTDPSDRRLLDTAFAEELDRGARAVAFYSDASLFPGEYSESTEIVASHGQRRCAVTVYV